jgi:hypothetical protein
MASSPSLPAPRPAPGAPHQLWSLPIEGRPRGLGLAREKGWLLAWDENNWLYLLNRKGERQAQRHSDGGLAAACCADDGSAYAAVGSQGEVWWFAPDLMPRWQRTVGAPAVAAALDPFGQCLAVSNANGQLHLFDRRGRVVGRGETPRPLHHIAFVPEAPRLVGAADFGLVACFDPAGRCLWREGLVAHVGSLAVSSAGRIALACFTEGLRFYTLAGRKEGGFNLTEPCRLAAVAFDGSRFLATGLGNRLVLLDGKGNSLESTDLEAPALALALAALGDTAVVALADHRLLALAFPTAAPAGGA